MLLRALIVCAIALVSFSPLCRGQPNGNPENATTAVLRAFDTHDVVMLGEFHGNKQLYEWLQLLVATPAFADRVDDIALAIRFRSGRLRSS